jgi:hypothetical protein
MNAGLNAKLHPQPAICEVCGIEITFPDSLALKGPGPMVCRSFDCRRVASQKSSMAPAMFESFLKFNREMIQRQRDKNTSRKKRIDDIKKKEQQETLKLYQSVLDVHAEYSEDNLDLLVIPSGGSELIDADSERAERYVEYLTQIINEAVEYSNADEVIYDEHHDAHAKRLLVDQRLDTKPSLRTVCDELCAMCKGGCCASGKDHAYLSVFSMRRYMDAHPQLTAQDLLNLYCSYVVSTSIADSCINHTETGCALPRDLRSDICNGYYCESLKTYQEMSAEKDEQAAVLVVQRSSSYWDRFESGVSNEVIDVVLLDGNVCKKLASI